MKETYRVIVLIPTNNDEKLIEATILSVKNQTFKNVSIIVIDNKSDDMTYEKAMDFFEKNFAIYQLPKKVVTEELISASAKLIKNANKGLNAIPYILILEPGNIIYPTYIEYCIHLFNKHKNRYHIIVSEVDIKMEDECVHEQIPLYSKDCILNTSISRIERKIYGYRHKVLTMYSFGILNDLYLGNRNFFESYQKGNTDWCNTICGDIIYSKIAAGIVREKHGKQIKDEILKDYGSVILEYLGVLPKDKNEERERAKLNINFAKRALYLAGLALVNKQFDEANDGILIAEMIHENIIKEDCYKFIKNATETRQALDYNDIESVFPSGENKKPPQKNILERISTILLNMRS